MIEGVISRPKPMQHVGGEDGRQTLNHYTGSHYSPIVNNSSLTSKRAHVCSPKAIMTSLAVS